MMEGRGFSSTLKNGPRPGQGARSAQGAALRPHNTGVGRQGIVSTLISTSMKSLEPAGRSAPGSGRTRWPGVYFLTLTYFLLAMKKTKKAVSPTA